MHDAGDIARRRAALPQAQSRRRGDVFPPDDLDLANFRQGLANLLRHDAPAGRGGAALPRRRWQPGRRRWRRTTPGCRLRSMGSAGSLRDAGSANRSSRLYERALAIRDKTDGPGEHRRPLNSAARRRADQARPRRGSRASVQAAARHPRKARRSRKRSAADAARWISPARQPGRTASAEAEIFHKRALAISEKSYGPDDLLTGFDLLALGLLYSRRSSGSTRRSRCSPARSRSWKRSRRQAERCRLPAWRWRS